jgi:hypothetical protein
MVFAANRATQDALNRRRRMSDRHSPGELLSQAALRGENVASIREFDFVICVLGKAD